MTSSSDITRQPIAHLIHDTYGDLVRITIDDSEANQLAAENGKTATLNVSADDIEMAMGPMPADQFMDDRTWQTIAPGLKALADHLASQPNPYDRWPAKMPATPNDLPQELLDMRISSLGSIYHTHFDLGVYIELQELQMSRNSSRPTSQALFEDASWNSSWGDIAEEDEDMLLEQLTMIAEQQAENRSERAAFGDSAPGSHRQDVLGSLAAGEIEYWIRQRATESVETDQGTEWTDIPY